MDVMSKPTISRAGFVEILEQANSPAAPVAGEIYELFAGDGLNPAVGLAFFQHESSYGLAGVATRTRNWGNIRYVPVEARYADRNADGWAWFERRPDEAYAWEWYRSADAFRRLIVERYVDDWKLTTVRSILQKYAPTSDGNVPEAYADAVEYSVRLWSQKYPVQDGPTVEARVEVLEEIVTRQGEAIDILFAWVTELNEEEVNE
jgi:hypothetical protein